MTQYWRGDPDEERPIDRWFRGRWEPGSVVVLDIDKVIAEPGYRTGALFELKHVDASEFHWRLTSELARRLGWWGGLILHDGSEPVRWTLQAPDCQRAEYAFDPVAFDAWAATHLGAKPV